jgi:hypothetical protein
MRFVSHFTFERDSNLKWKPKRSAKKAYIGMRQFNSRKRLEKHHLTPIPPNKINNEETSVIPISEAIISDLISGIPGN